jgi:hypothetical protein
METIHTDSASEIKNENAINWYNHFQNFKQSGLSKAAYARAHHIIKSRFIYWCKKFEIKESEENVTSGAETGFAALKVKPASTLSSVEVLCTLEIEARCKLLVHDLSALKMILASLELKPCY